MAGRKGLGLRANRDTYGHMLSINVSKSMADNLRAYAAKTNAPSMALAIRELLQSGLERYYLSVQLEVDE